MSQAEARVAPRRRQATRHRPERELHDRRSLERRRRGSGSWVYDPSARSTLQSSRSLCPRSCRGGLDCRSRADRGPCHARTEERRHPVSAPAPSLKDLSIKIFADGADRAGMLEMARLSCIAGFTTNPTLMRKAGVAYYESFAHEIIEAIPDRPISFEVFSDETSEMERQARRIATWGPNVYVKIPITNTTGAPSYELIRRLAQSGIKTNVTAILTLEQVREVSVSLAGSTPACVSVFAGRIADTGRDPLPMMAAAVELLRPYPNEELIRASP